MNPTSAKFVVRFAAILSISFVVFFAINYFHKPQAQVPVSAEVER